MTYLIPIYFPLSPIRPLKTEIQKACFRVHLICLRTVDVIFSLMMLCGSV